MNTVTQWRQRLVEQCSLDDIKLLCAELEVDFDTLPDGGKGAKALELVQLLARHDRLGELERAFNQYHSSGATVRRSSLPNTSELSPPPRNELAEALQRWFSPIAAGIGLLLIGIALLANVGAFGVVERMGWAGGIAVVGFLLVGIGLGSRFVGQWRNFAYQKRYQKYLGHRHRTFDVKGLSTQGTFSLELEQVFVELTLDPSSLPTSDPLQRSRLLAETSARTIWEHLAAEPLRQHHLVLLGPPGSGKTTLLKHVTLAGGKNGRDTTQTLPILLFLRDHTTAICQRPTFSLLDALHTILTRDEVPFPLGWWQRQLAAGRCLILLDGLDEVAEAGERRAVVAWVERQMTRYALNRFLVTSRPHGYKANPFGDVPVVVMEVRPFTQAQVRRFVQNWYLANEIMAAQKEDEGVRLAARDGATDLLNRLRRTPTLAELAVNPLLLTMIATVHRYRSALPGRRGELYAEICEVFLGKRRGAVGITDLDLTPAQKQSVLEPLAYHMMVRNQREIPLTEAVQVIEAPLALVGTPLPAAAFLKGVEESSGLLLERENGSYGFAHKTFQEYLAAVHIKQHQLESDLLQRLEDPWWHETIRLHCAQTDATPIIEACLDAERGSVAALALAIECAEEAKQLQATTRAHLAEVLEAGVESEDDVRRRLVAETLLTLRLRRMRSIGEELYLDDTLITHAEYQLFLDEKRAQGQSYHPDHWKVPTFPNGTGTLPVVGVRSSDAIAFCEWLTERDPTKEWRYRLPTVEEVSEKRQQVVPSIPGVDGVGYWAHQGGRFEWVSADGNKPRIASEKLWSEAAARYKRLKHINAEIQEIETFWSPISNLVIIPDLIYPLDRIRAFAHSLSVTITLALELSSNLSLRAARAFDLDRDLRRARLTANEFFLEGFDLYNDLDFRLAQADSISVYLERTQDLAAPLKLNHAYATIQALILNLIVWQRMISRCDPLQLQHDVGQFRQELIDEVGDVWLNLVESLKERPVSWRNRIGLSKDLELEQTKARLPEAFDLFRNLVILDLRCRGELPAYEGIRLVKERRDS